MRVPDPSLLLLIPAYNEEARIEPVLRDYARFFKENYHGKFQMVVILNGCRDNTLGVVQRTAKDFFSVSYLDFPEAIGKGGALIEGLKLAPFADLIGYVDADGATPPQAFLDLVKKSARRTVSSVRAGCLAPSSINRRRATASSPAAFSISSCNCCSG